jgi:dihydrofolate reductase
MKISLIAAVSANNVIGYQNRIPWHLSEDLKNFKKLTMGKPILMGRKTFDSLPRVLPGRTNVVLSKNPDYAPEGCRVFSNVSDALSAFSECPEIMVIGGATFYEQMLPSATKLYLTVIEEHFVGDTFFPTIDFSEWMERSRQDMKQSTEPYLTYSFRVYERTGGSPPLPIGR